MTKPIRIGILGAGLFARDRHAPALNALQDDFTVVAICSRTEQSARSLAELFPSHPDVLTDPDALFAHDDIDAVDVLLPIPIQVQFVEKALASGKHVFSEKPISSTVAEGRALLDGYRQTDQVWMVAENWRYSPSITRGAELIQQGALGKLAMFNWSIFAGYLPGTRYYSTEWRRDGGFPGGMLLDGGVHFIAGLRAVLGEVHEVSARAAQIRADLRPIDTLIATIKMESGLLGTVAFTFATRAPTMTFLNISGDNGFLEVNYSGMRFWQDDKIEQEIDGMGYPWQAQFADFAAAIRTGKSHRNGPIPALQDVAVVEALLKSAETGEAIQPDWNG